MRIPISSPLPRDGMRRHAVEAEAREQQRKAAEEPRQLRDDAILRHARRAPRR